ncbi:unknown [Bacteroides sp. CAG:462]|nr:unknown [Bacteroides sp. CAG:462]
MRQEVPSVEAVHRQCHVIRLGIRPAVGLQLHPTGALGDHQVRRVLFTGNPGIALEGDAPRDDQGTVRQTCQGCHTVQVMRHGIQHHFAPTLPVVEHIVDLSLGTQLIDTLQLGLQTGEFQLLHVAVHPGTQGERRIRVGTHKGFRHATCQQHQVLLTQFGKQTDAHVGSAASLQCLPVDAGTCFHIRVGGLQAKLRQTDCFVVGIQPSGKRTDLQTGTLVQRKVPDNSRHPPSLIRRRINLGIPLCERQVGRVKSREGFQRVIVHREGAVLHNQPTQAVSSVSQVDFPSLQVEVAQSDSHPCGIGQVQRDIDVFALEAFHQDFPVRGGRGFSGICSSGVTQTDGQVCPAQQGLVDNGNLGVECHSVRREVEFAQRPLEGNGRNQVLGVHPYVFQTDAVDLNLLTEQREQLDIDLQLSGRQQGVLTMRQDVHPVDTQAERKTQTHIVHTNLHAGLFGSDTRHLVHHEVLDGRNIEQDSQYDKQADGNGYHKSRHLQEFLHNLRARDIKRQI